MNKHRLFLVCLFFLLLITNTFAYDLRNIEESASQLRFRILNTSSPEYGKDPLVPEENFLRMENAKYSHHDDISLPYWSFKIALPDTQKPRVTLTNLQTVAYENRESVTLPEDQPLYEISNIGYAGATPVMELKIFPLQPGESGNQLQYITTAGIQIDFATPSRQKVNQQGLSNPAFVNQYAAESFKQYPKPQLSLAKPGYPAGQWFRVTISDRTEYEFNNESEISNIYKITYEDLQEAGLEESQITKDRIFLYSNPTFGQFITNEPDQPLHEITRAFSTGNNGSFTENDYIYFYGKTPTGLYLNNLDEVDFLRNPYSFENYYWVLVADNAGSPKAITLKEKNNNTPDFYADTTDYLYRKEQENFNVLESGNNWYYQIFDDVGGTSNLSFYLPNADRDYTADLEMRFKSGTDGYKDVQFFEVQLNNNLLNRFSVGKYNTRTLYFTKKSMTPGRNSFRMEFYKGSGKGYLDYIQCKYVIKMTNIDNNFNFYAPEESGNIGFILQEKYTDTPMVFDISDPGNVKQVQIEHRDPEITFTDYNPGNRNAYLLTSETNFSVPDAIKEVESPDFNSLYDNKDAQYIIITNDKFLSAASRIAELHNSKVKEGNRLSTFITTQEEIMRQFNGDVKDVEAIRYFLKQAYDNWSVKPEYVLLLGDGSFDHRNIKKSSNNYIMTYQVFYYNAGYEFFSTDFCYSHIHGNDKWPDLAIGRIPAQTEQEAMNYVAKLEDYILNPDYGSWRHTFSLVADDPEDPHSGETYFTEDSETLANKILPDFFNPKKLYLVAYPDAQDDSKYGRKKPAATQAILDQLEEGTTIINYMGHGGPDTWSQEKAFTSENLPELSNENKLPFWIAGTCTWGKYDAITIQSTPEELINMNSDGGIATLAASRPTYGMDNFQFLTRLFNYWFPAGKINKLRLGKILQDNINGADRHNDAKYIYFGDPALYLSLPYGGGSFDELSQDTLKALDNVKVSGNAMDQNFSGRALVTLRDASRVVTKYYLNDDNVRKSINYKLPGDLLFKGKVNVENGKFASSFFIPKDLNYSDDFGKLHIYGWNSDEQSEFAGVYDSLIFAGSANITDSTGPVIQLKKNNDIFYDGGLINSNDRVALHISDEHGINLTGKMGHNISVQLDDETYDFTADFAYDENSDTSGAAVVDLPESMEPGEHYLTIKAWDNANNSNLLNLSFNYSQSTEFKISKIANYPNPFKKQTDITFYSSEPCEYTITIYSLNGLKVKEFRNLQSSPDGFNRLFWNGKDDFGDTVARGTYLYKIKAQSILNDKKDTHIGKMVKS
ncbi:MAG: type IX secretion system sortase PorU [Fidelibacterota bacterium]